jgi:hypothetical protein
VLGPLVTTRVHVEIRKKRILTNHMGWTRLRRNEEVNQCLETKLLSTRQVPY